MFNRFCFNKKVNLVFVVFYKNVKFFVFNKKGFIPLCADVVALVRWSI